MEQSADLFINMPIFNDTIIKNVEIIERFETDTIPIDDKNILLKQRYLITSFDTGLYVIPSFPFFISKESNYDTLISNPLIFAVLTLEIDTANAIHDIKQPIGAPFTFAEILQYLKENWHYVSGALILLGGIAFLIYYYIRRKNNQPIFGRKKPEPPPHIIAYERLDKLKEKKLWQRNKIKEYYSELTNIIREYLEKRYNINALEQTSEEILQSFKYIRFEDDKLFNNLKRLLLLADLVKFAKESPLPDENEIHIKDSYIFIDKTKLVTEENDEENEKEIKSEMTSNEAKKEAI